MNPENQKPSDDLFTWGDSHVKQEQVPSNPVSEELDETDTCPMCQNGGFCAKHNVRPRDISELQKPAYEVVSSDEEINKELQRAVNSPHTGPDFASNEEAAEYFASLMNQKPDEEDTKKAS